MTMPGCVAHRWGGTVRCVTDSGVSTVQAVDDRRRLVAEDSVGGRRAQGFHRPSGVARECRERRTRPPTRIGPAGSAAMPRGGTAVAVDGQLPRVAGPRERRMMCGPLRHVPSTRPVERPSCGFPGGLWIGAEMCTAWTHTRFAGFTHAFRSETVCDARKRRVAVGERGHESAPTADGGGADVGNYFLRPGAFAPALKPSAPGLACGGGGVDSILLRRGRLGSGSSVAGA